MTTTYIEPDSDEELHLRLDRAVAVLQGVYPDAKSASPKLVDLYPDDYGYAPVIVRVFGGFRLRSHEEYEFNASDLHIIAHAIDILNGQL